jgi:hypothetical protein
VRKNDFREVWSPARSLCLLDARKPHFLRRSRQQYSCRTVGAEEGPWERIKWRQQINPNRLKTAVNIVSYQTNLGSGIFTEPIVTQRREYIRTDIEQLKHKFPVASFTTYKRFYSAKQKGTI